jgi:hypothetical protein
MKHLIRLLACCAMFAAFALPALAQGTTGADEGASVVQDDPCDALYRAFYEARVEGSKTKDFTKAYAAGKEYLQKCPADTDYGKAVKKFVDTYEKEERRKQMYAALRASNYDEAFNVGKQVVVDYPEDPVVFYDLTRAGADAADLKNTKNNADTATYARRSIALAEAGKLPNKVTKDMVLGEAYNALGTVTANPDEQVPHLIRAAGTQVYAKDPGLYFKLAFAYQNGEYEKNEEAYKEIIKGDKSGDDPLVVAALKKYAESTDRLMDALARTIVFATKPEFANLKTQCTQLITSLYQFRNKSDAGLQGFINSILSKPLPQPGQPIDYFPPPPPPAEGATTPANGTATPANGTTTTPAGGAKPAAGGTTTPAGGAKPKPVKKPIAKKGKPR